MYEIKVKEIPLRYITLSEPWVMSTANSVETRALKIWTYIETKQQTSYNRNYKTKINSYVTLYNKE